MDGFYHKFTLSIAKSSSTDYPKLRLLYFLQNNCKIMAQNEQLPAALCPLHQNLCLHYIMTERSPCSR